MSPRPADIEIVPAEVALADHRLAATHRTVSELLSSHVGELVAVNWPKADHLGLARLAASGDDHFTLAFPKTKDWLHVPISAITVMRDAGESNYLVLGLKVRLILAIHGGAQSASWWTGIVFTT